MLKEAKLVDDMGNKLKSNNKREIYSSYSDKEVELKEPGVS